MDSNKDHDGQNGDKVVGFRSKDEMCLGFLTKVANYVTELQKSYYSLIVYGFKILSPSLWFRVSFVFCEGIIHSY